MQSLKSAARRGVVMSVTALSALALASCSAGQVTQTSEKVIAVDGTNAETEDGLVAVRDVTILLGTNTAEAALKFTAVNQGYETGAVTLESISVDGQEVQMDATEPMEQGQSIQGDSAEALEALPQTEGTEVQYVETSLENEDFGYAGNRNVTFEFSNGTLEIPATISAPDLTAGEYNRDADSIEGYTTEEPSADEH